MAESAPAQHKFKLSVFQPNDPKNFIKFVRKEVKLLRTSLPAGIHVKGFEDRMDLYSVMIMGPERTPYENGVFFFDFQLSADYPKAPPVCHYVSYVSDRLNPNLYEDGKVCVSLLGTWSGKGTETWTPNSNLLQLLVSIQGLILVAEPYFNEAGYERQKGTQQGVENSRMYNEMVVLKLVQSMTRLASNPPEAFKDEVKDHLRGHSKKLINRIESWRQMSLAAMKCSASTTPDEDMHTGPESYKIANITPDFPLVPASKGFCLSLERSLEAFKKALKSANLD
jgi:ubiquitin-conjugating enzyme E2 O